MQIWLPLSTIEIRYVDIGTATGLPSRKQAGTSVNHPCFAHNQRLLSPFFFLVLTFFFPLFPPFDHEVPREVRQLIIPGLLGEPDRRIGRESRESSRLPANRGILVSP